MEVLAGQLGLAAPSARWGSSTNQTNYAVGGAKTDYTLLPIVGAVGMDSQVGWFQADLGNNPGWNVSDALFVLWGGGNDYFGYLDSGGPIPTPALNLRQRIETLIALGATAFLTCNLPPLGDTPAYRGTSQQAEANQLSEQFAADWQQQVNELSALHPQCAFYYLDVYAAFQQIVANPENYGLRNVTDPAFDGSTVVSNADEYLFWDNVHPTRVGHALIGAAAYNQIIPEPTSAALLLLSLPLVWGRCRARHSTRRIPVE